jgi:hypothetical protein
MPFVKFPTAGDDIGTDEFEGGLIFPFAMELPGGFTLGLMAEFDIAFDDVEEDHTLEFLHTVSLGHDIAGDLAGYVEYIGLAPLAGQ